jgi:hypothetical protein
MHGLLTTFVLFCLAVYSSLSLLLSIQARAKGSIESSNSRESDAFLFVTASSVERASLLTASRLWRKHIPAFALVNCPALAAAHALEGLEELDYYPDASAVPSNPGVHRLAMAPALAAAHLAKTNSNYRWMLYGDDDTVFVVHNVQQLLRGYNAALPVLLSDSYWWVLPARLRRTAGAAAGNNRPASEAICSRKAIPPAGLQERPGRQRWPDMDCTPSFPHSPALPALPFQHHGARHRPAAHPCQPRLPLHP